MTEGVGRTPTSAAPLHHEESNKRETKLHVHVHNMYTNMLRTSVYTCTDMYMCMSTTYSYVYPKAIKK